jgi:hypothetical protein
MSFPNPDNYARDCDCGTAGANTTPPPATIQGEIDSLDTRVTALEETNDVIVSSGGIAALTTAQQALIREGSIVVTTDGKRWVYSGAGSKVLEASYIELSDLTIGSTANLPLITGAGGVITAGSFGSSANTFCQGDDVRVDHVRPLGTNNIFVSNTVLSSASLSGGNNTGVGVNALALNTTGNNNTASGSNALSSNTGGGTNTASGVNALLLNTTGNSNTANGGNALAFNTTGINNTASGSNALYNNKTGNRNTASGLEALYNNGITVTAGSFAVGVSYTIQFVGTTNWSAIGAGIVAVGAVFTATGVGSGTGTASSNTNNNTATGFQALYFNKTGINNTATGFQALYFNTTGGTNTASGVDALYNNTTGLNNTADGYRALFSNTTGANSVAIGYLAASSQNTIGEHTAVGSQAMKGAFGANGTDNTAVGFDSLSSLTTGARCTCVGHRSGRAITAGNNNTLIGQEAGLAITSGANNTALGADSLGAATGATKANNTAIGWQAGNILVTGKNNTMIGSDADVDATGRNYCVVIGKAATSPAVDGSLSIGGTAGEAMAGLTTTTAPTGATGSYLRIWLNGSEYRIPIQLAV